MNSENAVNNTTENISGSGQSALEFQLSEKVKNLLFPSESESLIETVCFEKEPLISLKEQYADKTDQIVKNDFDEFYDKYAVKKDWQNDARKQFADKLSAALDIMKENLKDIAFYRIGEVNVDVYVVGQTLDEKWIGLKTNVVET